MKTVAIITEFNPFHKGHEYIIKKAKEVTGATCCIIITSGNYVQRGEPSFIDKYTKTEVALNHGADIVFELPVFFSTASARYFSMAAVGLLDKLQVVDYLAFGVESNSLEDLSTIVQELTNENDEYKEYLRESQKCGNSFPTSRRDAILKMYGEDTAALLDTPNNILAIEYMRALALRSSNIKPIGIKRIKAAYHEDFNEIKNITDSNYICSEDSPRLYSASNLRKLSDDSLVDILSLIDNVYAWNYKKTYPVGITSDFSAITGLKLYDAIANNTLSDIFDLTLDIANKFANNFSKYTNFSSFITLNKSKDVSYTSLSRALLHIALDIKTSHVNDLINQDYGNFIRLLGFNNIGKSILPEIKSKSSMTVISNMAAFIKDLDSIKKDSIEKDSINKNSSDWIRHCIRCDDLYRLITISKHRVDIPNEFTKKFIKCD
ncbi:MAG: nucleotidyltransferase family protein [Clostridiales bacterium]|nr:nucleotidyltransferase family protein [Clostridiales bacterium]